MGCGASKSDGKGKDGQPPQQKEKQQEQQQQQQQQSPAKKTEEKQSDKPKESAAAAPPAAAPAASPAAPEPGAAAAAPASGAAAAGASPGASPTAAEEMIVQRDKLMPAPLFHEAAEKDKGPTYIVSCYAPASGGDVVCFACRLTVHEGGKKVALAEPVHLATKSMTREQLEQMRDGMQKGPDGETIDWKSFWKMLNTAFQTGRVTVASGGCRLDVKMRQSKEPKEQIVAVDLDKGQSSPEQVFAHFTQPFARHYAHRAAPKEDGEKDKRDLKESDYLRCESEGTSRLDGWAVSEAAVLAAESAERRWAEEIPKLRKEAERLRRSMDQQQNQMAKMNQVIEVIKCGAPSHPLDKMYGVDMDAYTPSGKAAAVETVDASRLGLDTDVDTLGNNLVGVAVSLFEHYGIIDHFGMERATVVSYWLAVQERCNDNPFHGVKHAIDMMCVMNTVIGRADQPSSLAAKCKMSKEDIFSLLLAAGITDLHHEGVDNTFIKRSGNMLSMLYSDLYQTEQNALTIAFELMYDDSCNILKTLTPEQVKDVTESVREALFIKANVRMGSPAERFDEFRQTVAGGPDWTAKETVRLVLTHALRMCEWSPWARSAELHKKWLDRFREEYYQQGEKETKLGIPPSRFYDTVWTTARDRDDADFAAGQVSFIEGKALPLFAEMQRLSSDLDVFVSQAKQNKDFWEQEGGKRAAQFKRGLLSFGKTFTMTNAGGPGALIAVARPGPDLVRPGHCMWVSAFNAEGQGFGIQCDEALLAKCGADLKSIRKAFLGGSVTSKSSAEGVTLEWSGGASLQLRPAGPEEADCVFATMRGYLETRRIERLKELDKALEKLEQCAKGNKDKALVLESEAKALLSCLEHCKQQIAEDAKESEEIHQRLSAEAGDTPVEDMIKLEREDALGIKVRNPLKAPLPPGVQEPPDCKAVDKELLKVLKSRYYAKEGGASSDLTESVDPQKNCCCNVVLPMLTSDFVEATKNIPDPTRKQIFDLINNIDKWDYDVFELQTAMSGGISGECLRQQPHGGALFVTTYALFYKWQFMQKFAINEQTFLNWLSIVEAGYHPNPYHNSMHAADVLHVTHYIISKGGLSKHIRATDEEIFAALFAATVHDYNHPGINNAFHVRSQNYLAVLFNDRSVNENIHASSVFELMRMDDFNILAAFQGADHTRMRDDIVEFILGTDMGLHAMFVGRFKKRLEATDSKMYKTKTDRNLALTMAVKMADISNCGRPKKLYHGWCNVIVDEFFQQGDRERLQGMPVSPFMDRHTTVMSKGQIGFMNYIVMPLFECMGEYLEDMHMATVIAEENKGFWQENEDW